MLLSHGLHRSTIAAEELNERVRDENVCFLLAMATGKRMPDGAGENQLQDQGRIHGNPRQRTNEESSLTAD